MEYTIVGGDTLWALSRRFGTTVDAIAKANADTIKDPNLIFAGKTITIPEPVKPAAEAAAAVQPEAPAPAPAPAAAATEGAAAVAAPAPASVAAAPAPVPTVVPPAVSAPTVVPPTVSNAMPAWANVAPRPTYVAPAPTYSAPTAQPTYVAPTVQPQVRPASSVASAHSSREDHPWEQRVLDLVNEVRTSHGLRPVAWNAALNSEAEAHVAHMSRVNQMAHEGIGDGTPGQRMQAHGWSRAWGENVAVGQVSPEQVVREWMASPGHRANILNPSFAHLAIAFGTTSSGRPYWGQAFGA